MIIAIDETGDFNPESRAWHFFAGVHLPSDSIDEKQTQFLAWESARSPSKRDAHGEIKGSNLDEHDLAEFAAAILVPSSEIGITAIGIVPAQTPRRVVEVHQRITLAQLYSGIIEIRRHENRSLALEYARLARWFRRLNYQNFLKLRLTARCIDTSLRSAICIAALRDFKDDLVSMEFKLDESFIEPGIETQFWHELLRQQTIAASERNPVVVIDDWEKTGHPFVKAYGTPDLLDLRPILRDRCTFVKSHDHWEVRVADVVATIFHRVYNRRQCLSLIDVVRSRCWSERKWGRHRPIPFEGIVLANVSLDEAARGLKLRAMMDPNNCAPHS